MVIEPEWVQAAIWVVNEGKAEVVSVSPPSSWGSEEELVGIVDTALSAAIQSFPEEEEEPSKTVFGVSSTWVSDGQIKPEYLEKLKNVCSTLSLTPVGFVVLPEAIAHLIKSEEGAPLSGVVLGLGSENIEVSVFRMGALSGTTTVARSVSLVDDVTEGLVRFAGTETLPSRLLLYDGKEGELEEAKQSLLRARWDDEERVKFLHTPKIETVNPERKVEAVVLAGASEIANVSSLTETKEAEERGVKKEEVDIPKSEELVTPDKPVSAEDMGFVVGQDVATFKTSIGEKEEDSGKTVDIPSKPLPQQEEPEPEETESRAAVRQKETLRPGIASLFIEKVRMKVVPFLNKVKRMFFPNLKLSGYNGKRTLFLGPAFLFAIFIVGFVLWWYLPKATVTVYVSPKKLNEKLEILVDPDASTPDFSERVLPGELIETSVSGEKTKSTSGTKLVGEKARGSVKIQNGTAQSIRLVSGTLLTSDNGLKFSLDNSASVSAALSPSIPGTATVEVTAVEIGSEYNLAKDESFTVDNYPKAEVDAVATSDFSGGSSRQIAAVAQEDLNLLEESLTEELLGEAKDKLAQKVSDSQFFIEESLVSTPSAKKFDSKVGDEADSVKLSLSIDAAALVVDKITLSDFVREKLKDRVPAGFVLRDDQIEMRFEFKGKEDGIYQFTTYIEANLLPEIKPDEVAKEISGRYIPYAKDYLNTIPGFTRAEISVKPKLPGRLATLPHVVKNISVEVAAER